jgi:hypothetical protein
MMTANTSSATAGPVCLVTALAQEHAVVRKCLGGDASSIVAVQSGIGRAAGFIAAEEASRMHPSLAGLVSIGFCGGLAPGTCAVAPSWCPAASSRRIPKRALPLTDWHAALQHTWPRSTPKQKRRFIRPTTCSTRRLRNGPFMSSARHVRWTWRVPASPTPHSGSRCRFLPFALCLTRQATACPGPQPTRFMPTATSMPQGLVSGLVRNPKDVPALMALGRKSSLAQKQLKAVCEALGPAFGRG